MLQAYHRVLSAHNIQAAEDMHYYHLLIALSLRPEPGWWERLQAQRCKSAPHGMLDSNPREGQRPGSKTCAVAPSAKQRQDVAVQTSHHAAADLQQQCAAGEYATKGRKEQHPGDQQQGTNDTDWQEVAEEFLAQTGCMNPQQEIPAQHSRRAPDSAAMPEKLHASSAVRVTLGPLMVQVSAGHPPARSTKSIWHAHDMQRSSQPAEERNRHPLAERALNRQQSSMPNEQQKQRWRRSHIGQSGMDEQQLDGTGSVNVAGLIHGRSYKLVPIQARDALAHRGERVTCWLNEAAAAASGQACQHIDPPDRGWQRRRPSIGGDAHHQRALADTDQHRRSSAGRRQQQRRVSVTQPARVLHQSGEARDRSRSLTKQTQWRSKSSSPLGRREHMGRSQISRRSASPQPSHAGQTRQEESGPVSIAELKRSYAAWQRATQRLIDIGHAATQRRHWRIAKRVFEVNLTVGWTKRLRL